MPTIKIQAQLSKDDLLAAVQQLSSSELDGFLQDIIALKAQHQAPSLSTNETDLLLQINQGLSSDIQKRYQILIHKRNQETLTEQEYYELLQLTEAFENHQANRLESLAKLAQLRQISLTDLMTQLGIKPTIND
ncbi:MAG: STAS/SEC14 domain-containing protein [Crocosphaera sp.]|nr:STAS/SEC14 domain-containing protein [Crocosphaera sp.]